jgi:hypothetical protein
MLVVGGLAIAVGTVVGAQTYDQWQSLIEDAKK